MTAAGRPRSFAAGAVGRVRAVAGPLSQTAIAAAVAWYAAHDLLGHAQPFFAPIAAAVALSTNHMQRSRRTVQMVVGVLLGIGVSELLHPLVGNGAVSIGVVVLVTLFAAVALGVGFVGEGMMFVNQAAASAVLVIALHKAGTGGERAVDALVGGAVALTIGVGLFPVEPLKLLWAAEAGVLRAVGEILERRPGRAADEVEMEWVLAASHRIHVLLTALTQARGTARTAVRVAPRRLRMRPLVEAEERRVAHLYLLAGGALALARTMVDLEELEPGASERFAQGVDTLARAVRELLATRRPWPRDTVAALRADLQGLRTEPLPHGRADAVLAASIKRTAGDVVRLLPDG
ncbi:MAG TPA: FUSC family protein [Solirubrobacteraceae bacterium]|nr:FUSC family protein [Solirubrobacteraceae bacterium]